MVDHAISCAGSPRITVAQAELAIDPHVHTLFSHCSISQPERIIRHAAAIGLDGVGIMDHNETRGSDDAIRCADYLKSRGEIPEHFLIIPGTEVSSKLGHICALFVREELPKDLSCEETVRVIHEAGGLALAPHPYHSTGINAAVFDAPFDAVEVQCGSVFGAELVRRNRYLATDPRLQDVAKFGAGDAHYLRAIGSCYTIFKAEQRTLDAVRHAVASGDCIARSSAPCTRLRRVLGRVPKLK